jgi:sugar phosphate isomerase/epimerase
MCLAYARALAGDYQVIELPGAALSTLADVVPELRAAGYGFSVHARYQDLVPGSSVPEVREIARRVLRADLEEAARVQAEVLNVHAGAIPWTDYPPPGLSPAHEALRSESQRLRQAYTHRAMGILRDLANAGRKLGLRVVLENLPDMSEFPRTPDEMREFSEIDELSFCVDLGHVALAGCNSRAFWQALGDRIVHVHAHANDGRYDLHLRPRWGEHRQDLLGFSGIVIVELAGWASVSDYRRAHEEWVSAGFAISR